jgi:demethylmenaquinone methyltransferase/2-methoxy-6-polyprenyl-1,4-benzoquinol methylase/phosphoethanolamine N-methyltransferase
MLSHSHSGERPQTTGRTIRWAAFYDAFVTLATFGRSPAIRKATAELAGIQPGDKVLDVGCGTGDLSIEASRLAGPSGQVYGIDAAPEMIDVARRKMARQKVARTAAGVDFRVGLIEAIDFPDGYFDAVLSSLMMHHLPDDLKQRGLREVRRVLKPGGRLLIVDFKRSANASNRAHMALLLHRNMPRGVQDLTELMERAGFGQIETGDLRAGFGMLGFVRGVAV